MNRATIFLLGSLMLLLSSSAACGQGCATILQPHFSVYYSSSRDGYNIYTSVSIQGYASVGSSAGCNMSSATHHVGAENKLNNVDHWTYSANGCPTCYFSASNNEQLVGVPGVDYPWTWESEAICSIVGGFFGDGGGGSFPGCLAPSSETTTVQGTEGTTYSDFIQVIYDSAGDNFSGLTVTEGNAAPGQDTCWGTWSIGPRYTGIPTNPASSWPVAGGQLAGQANHWGPDAVGWSQTAVDYYRVQDPAHGIGLPCGFTGYQSLTISCSSGLTVPYTPSYGNKLTAQIEQTVVVNCRYDMNNSACPTINY
ncbi:MAG: hypothetical protein WA853_15240 [Candidatus Acidiferrum sp.]